MPRALAALFAILALTMPAHAQPPQPNWKPAAGPLSTRWSAGVPLTPLPEQPTPQFVRDNGSFENLNGLWQFAIAKEGEPPPFDRDLPDRIRVPFPVESALSGVMQHHERLWYRRLFTDPSMWRKPSGDRGGLPGRVLLHFGASDWQTTAYVNGQLIGTHRGGYDPFSFDITSALTRKTSGQHELIVGVWDPTDAGTQPRGKQVRDPKGIFYTPTTGIWQPVWLDVVPSLRVESLRLDPDIDRNQLLVRVFHGSAPDAKTIEAIALDAGAEVARVEATTKPGTDSTDLILPIPNPKLWSPEHPFLYDLKISLRSPDGQLRFGSISAYFAMRKISLDKDSRGVTRLFLNNQPCFMVGPLDQGFWPDGIYTAPSDEALRSDIETAKRLGFNMIRKHVKVEPDRWYYWCDKLGILVWQDMPSGDRFIGPNDPDITRTPESAAQYEAELTSMINHLRNHPCIIMWVVFNEGWGQFDTPGIVDLARRLDPTRLVDCASGWTDRSVGDVIDVHAYPGPASPKPEPSRAAVLGEFGGLGLRIDGHAWAKDSWGYQGMADTQELTDRYVSLLRRVYELKDSAGLCAAVYTQTTDVETECNGLLTFDRAVLKPDADRVASANRGLFPTLKPILPTAQTAPASWRYTLDAPPASAAAGAPDWFSPTFDDSAWSQGPSGFGAAGTPGAVIGTPWNTSDIWLRRRFDLPANALTATPAGAGAPGAIAAPVSAAPPSLFLLIHHDEDAQVYLNGVLAADLKGYTTDYTQARIAPVAAATLKPGPNLIAIHCKQTTGGQFIDAGLVAEIPAPK